MLNLALFINFQQVIKSEQSAIAREIKQRKNLEKIRDKKPGDAQSIVSFQTNKNQT